MKTTHTCLAVLSVFLLAGDAAANLWTTPEPVSGVNTGYDEGAPFPTYDGQSLYFSRQGDFSGVNTGHLFSAAGPSSPGQFTGVQEWPINNAGGSVIYGWVSEDNRRLYYSESLGTTRYIKMTERISTAEAWTAGSGVDALNGLGNVANPSLTQDELTIVFASADLTLPGGQGGWDIWMGTRDSTGDPFSDFTNLSLVNSGGADTHPRLSADGLTLYFASTRNSTGDTVLWQLFEATRPDPLSPFGTSHPLLIGGSPVYGQYPAIGADGRDLYFAKPVSGDGYDIFVSHAVPVPGAAVLGLLGLSCAGWRYRRRAA